MSEEILNTIKDGAVAVELRARASSYSRRQPATVKIEFTTPEPAAIFFEKISRIVGIETPARRDRPRLK